MRKSLALFLTLGVLCAAMLGALSVLPHSHGDDFDHSKHSSCPVHQFGLQDFQASVVSLTLLLFAFVLLGILAQKDGRFISSLLFSALSSRAPPVV